MQPVLQSTIRDNGSSQIVADQFTKGDLSHITPLTFGLHVVYAQCEVFVPL